MHFKHGDLRQDNIVRNPGSRIVTVCEVCIISARSVEDPLYRHLSETIVQLESVIDSDLEIVSLLETMFVKVASIFQKSFAKECLLESKTVKTFETIKNESKCLDFLSHKSRNKSIINALLTLTGHNVISEQNSLKTLPNKKVKNLCIGYESLMGLCNSKLTTAPSVLRNIKLLKATHSRDFISLCGYPTGGSYTLLQSFATSPLPELDPPQFGDFVSADDNLQVLMLAPMRVLDQV